MATIDSGKRSYFISNFFTFSIHHFFGLCFDFISCRQRHYQFVATFVVIISNRILFLVCRLLSCFLHFVLRFSLLIATGRFLFIYPRRANFHCHRWRRLNVWNYYRLCEWNEYICTHALSIQIGFGRLDTDSFAIDVRMTTENKNFEKELEFVDMKTMIKMNEENNDMKRH